MWRHYEIALLALTLWREARGESRDARIAVAHTVKNRLSKPGWWGNDWISVLTKKWQYSSLTDPKDGQLTAWPAASDHVFEECLEIAQAVIEGTIRSQLAGIDSYFDDSLQGDLVPKWARENPSKFVGKIGRLNFYNMDSDVEVLVTA